MVPSSVLAMSWSPVSRAIKGTVTDERIPGEDKAPATVGHPDHKRSGLLDDRDANGAGLPLIRVLHDIGGGFGNGQGDILDRARAQAGGARKGRNLSPHHSDALRGRRKLFVVENSHGASVPRDV